MCVAAWILLMGSTSVRVHCNAPNIQILLAGGGTELTSPVLLFLLQNILHETMPKFWM